MKSNVFFFKLDRCLFFSPSFLPFQILIFWNHEVNTQNMLLSEGGLLCLGSRRGLMPAIRHEHYAVMTVHHLSLFLLPHILGSFVSQSGNCPRVSFCLSFLAA